MTETMHTIMHPHAHDIRNPAFPYAPVDWTKKEAMGMARREGLELTDDHWATLRALQEYFSRHELGDIHLRELHDALDEHFHSKGGIKYLYTLFPGGPVAQGCRLAGLVAPTSAADNGFGSVA
jgi:tRNA 2-thiouridine synthesizing protein E